MTGFGMIRRGARWFLILLLWQPALSSGQSTIKLPPASTPELETVLSEGRELEKQRRWADALSLYEEATRVHPGQPALEERLDLTKIHYDLGRRYADSTFRKGLVKLSEGEALDLYTQVIGRIYTHYVQTPNWKSLVDRGTLGLSAALYEPSFLEHNLGGVDSDRIAAFRRDLQRLVANRSIRDRNDARDVVSQVARLGSNRLGLTPAATILEYVSGAAGGLDEYSTFLTAGQLNDIYSQIDGNFVGLGVELKAQNQALSIVNVIAGSPADKAGIRRGDRLVGVAGKSTRDLTTDQAADLLQGEEGSVVELIAVTGDAAPRRLLVQRQHVDVPSIEEIKLVDRDLGVGYVRITCFQKNTSADLDAALWQLHRQGMRSLVIDLRGNPGGLLTSAVELADKFLESGSIVSTRGRSPQEDFNYSARRAGTWRVPLVVLIDGDSASASEIFAGAMRDYRRAEIVGQKSYGKGSVQGIFPLSIGGTGIRLTTAKFYSPSGHPYSRVGVEPNIVVRKAGKPLTDDAAETSDLPASSDLADPVMHAAVEVARRQVASAK